MRKAKGLLFDGYNKYKEIMNYVIFGGLTTLVSLTIYYIIVLTVIDLTTIYADGKRRHGLDYTL